MEKCGNHGEFRGQAVPASGRRTGSLLTQTVSPPKEYYPARRLCLPACWNGRNGIRSASVSLEGTAGPASGPRPPSFTPWERRQRTQTGRGPCDEMQRNGRGPDAGVAVSPLGETTADARRTRAARQNLKKRTRVGRAPDARGAVSPWAGGLRGAMSHTIVLCQPSQHKSGGEGEVVDGGRRPVVRCRAQARRKGGNRGSSSGGDERKMWATVAATPSVEVDPGSPKVVVCKRAAWPPAQKWWSVRGCLSTCVPCAARASGPNSVKSGTLAMWQTGSGQSRGGLSRNKWWSVREPRFHLYLASLPAVCTVLQALWCAVCDAGGRCAV
eukprot:gene24710-biopygen8958